MKKATLVNLITDFGTRDTYVGQVKGRILREGISLPVVDTTHEVAPGDIWEGAFALWSSWKAFPPGTLHLVIVDPTVGSSRAILLAELRNQWVVCPDNGLLTFVEKDITRLYRLEDTFYRKSASTTFHGRDVFAPLVADVIKGRAKTYPVDRVERLPYQPPHRDRKGTWGTILHIDRFGNAITDLLVKEKRGSIEVKGQTLFHWVEYYAEGKPGELLLYKGSQGTLEIAIMGESAAQRLNLKRGDSIVWRLS